MQKKNTFNTIYIWRIVFTLMIMLFHLDAIYHIWDFFDVPNSIGWYIPVEFFFLVSGFLVYQKASSEQPPTAPLYLLGRIKKIWPPYFISFILTFIVVIYRKNIVGFFPIYEHLLDNSLEIFMLHGIGLGRAWNYINPETWYISILLICSFFIYYLLINHKEAFENLIAPAIIIVCYSWLYRNNGSLDVTISSMNGFYRNDALMRGFADMCMGVYAAKFSAFLQHKILNNEIPFGKNGILTIKISGMLSFLYVIVISMFYGFSRADFAYLLFLFYGVAVCFIPCEKFGININGEHTKSAKIILYFSRITLYQYLLHKMYKDWILPYTFPTPSTFASMLLLIVTYLLSVTVSSVLLDFIIRKLPKIYKALSRKDF